MNSRSSAQTPAVVRRFRWAGTSALLAGLVCVAVAGLAPVDGDAANTVATAGQRVPRLAGQGVAMAPLLRQVAGSQLIRPAQIQAAVKDTGTAKRLLERLKLQSVVAMRGEPMAYVRVKDGGVRSVRKGDHLLEFYVEEVAAGEVRLTLEGVAVTLTY